MKKLAICSFLILATICCNAQTNFGIKAGYNITNVKSDSSEFKYLTRSGGINLGIFILFPINEQLSFQTEIGFSGGGFNTSTVYVGDSLNPVSSVHGKKYLINYISIPLMVRYSYKSFNLQVGPQVGLLGRALVRDSYVITDGTNIISGTKRKDVQDFYKKADFGLAAGIGGEWGRFQISARYYLGVLNIANYGKPITNNAISVNVFWRLTDNY